MDLEHWRRVEELYSLLLSKPFEHRAAVLEVSCSNDPELMQEVKSLLEAAQDAGNFLSPNGLRGYITDLCQDAHSSLAGITLGPYQILDKIGAGSMGEVYRACDTRLDRLVALKVLPAHVTHEPARVARFRLEAKAASALNHPNIVTIYEVGQIDQVWFIAQEFIEGQTLRSRLSRGKLELSEALDVVTQTAIAVTAAHAAGILHRDLKPENIMLRPDQLVKVVDFGLARILRGNEGWSSPATQPGNIVGTPRYMSPEQARGETLDARSDVFSLGAILYELVEGRPAFPGHAAPQIFAEMLAPKPVATPSDAGPQIAAVISKSLQKDHEARYSSMEEFARDLKSVDQKRLLRDQGKIRTFLRSRFKSSVFALTLILVLIGSASVLLFHPWHKPALTTRDTILLLDFVNKTGDSVFDGTLKQGLAVQLEQSPFLNVFADARVNEVLRLMRLSPATLVTREVAVNICRREGIKAFVSGSIVALGSHYAITLEALDSRQNDTLARVQVEAEGKERVLHALSIAAESLRGKLGESLRSIHSFDALLERTTASLEALRAYSLGHKVRATGNFAAAIPYFRSAVELDPDFASAWVSLASCYRNTRQPGLAAQYSARAFSLRDRVSERERLSIVSQYCELVIGDLDKRLEVLKLFQSIYPRDVAAHLNMAVTYEMLGQFGPAVDESRIAVQLDPESAACRATFINSLVHLNRFSEAAAASQHADKQNMSDASIRQNQYRLAFMSHDDPGMDRQLQWAASRRDSYLGLSWQAGTAAYLGRWKRSVDFLQRSVIGATSVEANEVAAGFLAEHALRAAALKECTETRSAAGRALTIVHNATSLTRAGLALAWCGDTAASLRLVDEISNRYPRHTVAKRIWIPSVHAAIYLKQNRAAQAIQVLEPVLPYEAAADFWPQYLRASAYLQLHDGPQSTAEFQKILSNRGQRIDSVLYPLSQLGLARAAMLGSDAAAAAEAHKQFRETWANADPVLLRSWSK